MLIRVWAPRKGVLQNNPISTERSSNHPAKKKVLRKGCRKCVEAESASGEDAESGSEFPTEPPIKKEEAMEVSMCMRQKHPPRKQFAVVSNY